eukprot:scaffold12507_cov34-Cyclotella_meneghiniana.AAC.2
MKTSIDTLALAAAAEARARACDANPALMSHVSNMSPREGLDDARAATTIHSSTALPPLPPIHGVPPAVETVPVANQFSHDWLRDDQEDVLQNGQGTIIARVDKPHVATRKATASKSTTRRKPTFAEKLHLILSNKQLSSLITWLPSGKSFCILDKDRFTQRVLPVYFREVKFDRSQSSLPALLESFSRRIKRWGFKKMYTVGQKQVIYTHPLFQKDNFALCPMMNGRADRSDVKDEVVGNVKFQKLIAEQEALTDKPSQTQPSMNCVVHSVVQKKPQVQTMTNMPTMPMKNPLVPSLHVSLSIPRQVQVMNYDHVPMLHNRLRMERMSRLHQMEQMKQLEDANHMEQLKLIKQIKLEQSNRKKIEQMKLILQSYRMELMKMEQMKKMCMNPQGMGNNAHLMKRTGSEAYPLHSNDIIHFASAKMGNIQRMNQGPVDPKVFCQISALDEDIFLGGRRCHYL